jgi:hypothetical protein
MGVVWRPRIPDGGRLVTSEMLMNGAEFFQAFNSFCLCAVQILSNDFYRKDQRLDKRTEFQASDGLRITMEQAPLPPEKDCCKFVCKISNPLRQHSHHDLYEVMPGTLLTTFKDIMQSSNEWYILMRSKLYPGVMTNDLEYYQREKIDTGTEKLLNKVQEQLKDLSEKQTVNLYLQVLPLTSAIAAGTVRLDVERNTQENTCTVKITVYNRHYEQRKMDERISHSRNIQAPHRPLERRQLPNENGKQHIHPQVKPSTPQAKPGSSQGDAGIVSRPTRRPAPVKRSDDTRFVAPIDPSERRETRAEKQKREIERMREEQMERTLQERLAAKKAKEDKNRIAYQVRKAEEEARELAERREEEMRKGQGGSTDSNDGIAAKKMLDVFNRRRHGNSMPRNNVSTVVHGIPQKTLLGQGHLVHKNQLVTFAPTLKIN